MVYINIKFITHTNTHTHFLWESRLPVSFCSAVLSLWLSFYYITADCKMIPEVVIGKKKQGKILVAVIA